MIEPQIAQIAQTVIPDWDPGVWLRGRKEKDLYADRR